MIRPEHDGYLENDTSHIDILIIVLETKQLRTYGQGRTHVDAN